VHTQYPTTIFDRKMSDWGDVEFTMSPFLGTPTGSTLSTLRVRVYEKDTTVTD
jgi:hypothetical protein